MTHYQYAATILWIKIIKPIWSFIINGVFWVGHLNKIKQTRQEMVALSKLKLQTIMSIFRWREDNLKDWTPWVMTLAYNELQDDCDGAAALAKWWFKEHGVEAEILNLYSDKEGHTICVTKDRMRMVTNERVVQLFPETWEADIMNYFGNKYTVMI